MAPKTNIKSTKHYGSNDDTDVCLDVPFSENPRRVETSTLTCFGMQWAGLYMVRLLMLVGMS